MKFRTLAAATAALSLATAPAVAQSTVSRTAAPVSSEKSEVGGTGVILGILAAAAIIAGIIIAADGGSDNPISA